ncbi:hypothetical protein [Pectinatus frisingensis]|uniref:hypothetical protein n=1 Tax=Pectinatus frisingensis TaxID=865 RepID=UPI0018C7C329|nr:hypothetical protein [Pectinatus frisingensis]
MFINLKKLVLILLLGIILADTGTVAAETVIDDNNIGVNVISSGQLPLSVKDRMQDSVTVIARQLISGKTMEDIAANKSQYESVIKDVFNKILVGYTVKRVTITGNNDIAVSVELLPWDDTIKSVSVQVKTDGVSPEIGELALTDIKDIGSLFQADLYGLPIDAIDWTNGILKHSLNNFMLIHLPEFRADFEMNPGIATDVTVTIYPRMPVIRNIDLKMRSESMPNLYLLQERLFCQSQTDVLLGVPIAFVERHKKYFTTKIGNALDREAAFKAVDMHTSVDIVTGEKTYITTHSDAAKYNVNIEGWADFGRNDNDNNNIMYRIHLGRYLMDKHEIFSQIFIKPQETQVDWAAGYYYHFSDKWRTGGRYFFADKTWSIDTQRIFNKRWSTRFDYLPAKSSWQGAIRYNVHDFIGLEYIWERDDGKDDRWIRLIGNF